MQKFLAQVSNPGYSYKQSHSSDNAGSLSCWATKELQNNIYVYIFFFLFFFFAFLIHWVRPGIEPASSWRPRWVPSPLSHNRNAHDNNFWRERYYSVPRNKCEAGLSAVCHGCRLMAAVSVGRSWRASLGITFVLLCFHLVLGAQSSQIGLQHWVQTPCPSAWQLAIVLCAHHSSGQTERHFRCHHPLSLVQREACILTPWWRRKWGRLLGAPGSCLWLLLYWCVVINSGLYEHEPDTEQEEFHANSRHWTPLTIIPSHNQLVSWGISPIKAWWIPFWPNNQIF